MLKANTMPGETLPDEHTKPSRVSRRRTAVTEAQIDARLMLNTQFIYELQLAALETAALVDGGEVGAAGAAKMHADMRAFSVPNDAKTRVRLLQRSAYLATVDDAESDYARLVQHNVTRAMNQYITHWFYPYKGKFHPQMVRALANIIGMQRGETLLDPFIGSGTTAVEGALLGVPTLGFDVSPLCVLIGKVKANAVHHLSALQKLPVPGELTAPILRDERDINLDDALQSASAGFNLLARLISHSDHIRRRRDFASQLQKNFCKMRESIALMKQGCDEVGVTPAPAEVQLGDARNLPLADDSVHGVITSPPYSIALNYVENDAHALRYLGMNPTDAAHEYIGVRGAGRERATLYERDMRLVYAEIARVLKPGRCAAIVLGDATVAGKRVTTVEDCIAAFGELGFSLEHRINKIIFGLYNHMQREDILILRKPAA